MAVNISRSLNRELGEGATDGKYRKVRPNTTVVDPAMGDSLTRANRAGLHPFHNYGFIDTEKMDKVNPVKISAHSAAPSMSSTPVFDIDAYMTAQEK